LPIANISLSVPNDPNALGRRWEELQSRSDCSFFQSWSWVGCRAAERFSDPVLLEVELDGRVAALGLFNRRRGGLARNQLWLGESGNPGLDAIYVEHNGLLIESSSESLIALCLRAAMRELGKRSPPLLRPRIMLNGVGAATLQAVQELGLPFRLGRSSASPWIDLERIPCGPQGYLDTLRPNTRQQLRRSARRYAEHGPLHIIRAGSVNEAHRFLDELALLHQQSWVTRGKPGAFANPDFVRFHRSLIDRATPRGEIDLLRVMAGAEVLGYLYNFLFRGRVLAYQSGFDYGLADAQHKPGLTCHQLAIEMYLAEGRRAYDFLSGDQRYKTSLANQNEQLYWIELGRPDRLRAAISSVKRLGGEMARKLRVGDAGMAETRPHL
jgi:CelD/BcsL family acetyltransferase involved in cellulose biosynthesis